MTREEFLARYAEIERAYQRDRGNPGSFECRDCELCASCVFCERCTSCYRCNYCTSCVNCSQCNHCARCENCHLCAYSVESTSCTQSAYLTRCMSCSDCTYCFGCVGLVRKEFHILNEPYSRTDYFALVQKLRRELRIA